MSPKPKPRRIQVDGAELVVLTSAAYQLLDGSRRQVGAQSTRLRALREHLDALGAFLDELERVAADLPNCESVPCTACALDGSQCAREALAAFLRRPHPGGSRQD